MPFALAAEGFRVATLHAELTRKGPGLLLRDIERGKDDQIGALMQINDAIRPDILLLTKVDFDLEMRAANALKVALGYKFAFAVQPNSMAATRHDLDGDGRAGDRQSWARYAGEGAMLLLSQHPVELEFQLGDLLWEDIPNARMPLDSLGLAFPLVDARDIQKVVSQGLWVVVVRDPNQNPVRLILFQNQTPVFDGPEDLNGLRNAAQLGLVSAIMSGEYGQFPKGRFVVMGNANLDPNAGAGDRVAIASLLRDKRLQDPQPTSPMGSDARVVCVAKCGVES